MTVHDDAEDRLHESRRFITYAPHMIKVYQMTLIHSTGDASPVNIGLGK